MGWSHPPSLPATLPESCRDLTYRIFDEDDNVVEEVKFEQSFTSCKITKRNRQNRLEGPLRVGLFYNNKHNQGCVYSDLKGMYEVHSYPF